MRSYIIHMQGDEKRAPNVARLLETLPDAQVVDAVRGKDVMDEVSLRSGDLHKPRYPFSLSPGEVGCFLSHRKCWQRIAEGSSPYGMIVEDDLGVEPKQWVSAMALVERHAGQDSFIRLPAKQREKPGRAIDQSGSAVLFLPRVIGLQTVAQVVGRSAARRLLAATETLDRPVDTFLQMHWATQQPVQTILPNGVSELTDALGGSTIQKKSRASGKLTREFKRAWYRTQVALRPQNP